jgi:hypothetical protein
MLRPVDEVVVAVVVMVNWKLWSAVKVGERARLVTADTVNTDQLLLFCFRSKGIQ